MQPQPALTKPHLNIGTIGHFSHGKTTLSAAIARLLAKTPGARATPLSVEELTREKFLPRVSWGVPSSEGGFVSGRVLTTPTSVDSPPEGGFRLPGVWEGCSTRPEPISYETARRHYAHLDCPGHFSRWHTAASAFSHLDAAILVVSALESVSAQTREHLLLARQAGISQIVVFLSHCDQVADLELLDFAELETRETLSALGFPGDEAPVIRGAGLPAYEGDPLWESSLRSLIEALDALPQPPRDTEGPFLMPVQRVYSIRKVGTAVEGRVLRGALQRGSALELVGFGETRATGALSLEIFDAPVEEGSAGDYLGVLVRGLRKDEIRRGQVLAAPGTIKPYRRFLCDLSLITQAEGGRHTPIFGNYQAYFALGAACVSGAIRLQNARVVSTVKGDPLPPHPEYGTMMAMPGDRLVGVEVTLFSPVYLKEGMSFSFRDGCDGFHRMRGGPRVWGGTAGTGVITSLLEDKPT